MGQTLDRDEIILCSHVFTYRIWKHLGSGISCNMLYLAQRLAKCHLFGFFGYQF